MARGIGLDIGGANIKIYDTKRQCATSLPFALWEAPERLSDFLRDMVHVGDPIAWVAATMTGELCDCFESRREGVAAIVAAIRKAFDDSQIFIYQIPEKSCSALRRPGDFFCSAEDAAIKWPQVAAANWHATATWIAHEFDIACKTLMIDLGSTTTDIIPIEHRQVIARGRTDFERIVLGELVYVGMSRTPLQGVLPVLRTDRGSLRLANEWFCSVTDAYVVLGEISEAPGDCRTADRKPLTIAAASRRLARTLCAEPEEAGRALLLELARQATASHQEIVWQHIGRVADCLGSPRIDRYVLCGEGSWLLKQLLRRHQPNASIHCLADQFGAEIAAAAPAVAVAKLLLSAMEAT